MAGALRPYFTGWASLVAAAYDGTKAVNNRGDVPCTITTHVCWNRSTWWWDLAASKRFYQAILHELGRTLSAEGADYFRADELLVTAGQPEQRSHVHLVSAPHIRSC
jgi:hypothetical protein